MEGYLKKIRENSEKKIKESNIIIGLIDKCELSDSKANKFRLALIKSNIILIKNKLLKIGCEVRNIRDSSAHPWNVTNIDLSSEYPISAEYGGPGKGGAASLKLEDIVYIGKRK